MLTRITCKAERIDTRQQLSNHYIYSHVTQIVQLIADAFKVDSRTTGMHIQFVRMESGANIMI
jgi:hypothetical protein